MHPYYQKHHYEVYKGSPFPNILYAISISPTWTFSNGISCKIYQICSIGDAGLRMHSPCHTQLVEKPLTIIILEKIRVDIIAYHEKLIFSYIAITIHNIFL